MKVACSILFEIDEWQSVCAVVMRRKLPKEPPTLGEFMKMLATLGGHQGRKNGGPAEMVVIWRGLQGLYRLATGWRAYFEFS